MADGSRADRPREAAGLVLGASALFGLIDNFMRLAAAEGGLWQFHLLRAAVALAILVPVAWATGARLRPLRPGRVLLRSLLNSGAMVLYFGCLGLLPIAQVVAGLFTAPLFVVVFSLLLFRDPVGLARTAAVVVGFMGILLALGLRPADLTWLSALPVIAGALYGLGNLVTQRWCREEGTLALLGSFFGLMMAWGAVGCLVLWAAPQPVPEGADGFLVRGWVAPGGIFLAMIVIQGVGSLVGVGLQIRAYQIASPAVVAVLENALLVFATLWAIVLWGEVPEPVEWVGLGLVLVAGVAIALGAQPARAASPRIAGAAASEG